MAFVTHDFDGLLAQIATDAQIVGKDLIRTDPCL